MRSARKHGRQRAAPADEDRAGLPGARRGAGARRRREGFQVAIHAHGLEPLIIPGRYTLDGGSKGAKDALPKHPQPTAIFAANDLAAIGVLNSVLGGGKIRRFGARPKAK